MKKLISLLFIGMITVSHLSAMNGKNRKIITYDVPKKNYKMTFQQKFKSKQDLIPQLFSFADVWLGYNSLDNKNRRYVDHNLSQSLLFSFALCPQDIRRKILTIMLDNDEESAKIFDKKPTRLAFIQYNNIKQYSPVKVSNKIYSAGRLFRMPQKEIDNLRAILHPFVVIEYIIGAKSNIVSEATLKQIKTMPKNIIEDLEIRVVEEEYVDGCLLGPIAMGAISCFVCPFLSCPLATGVMCCMEGLFSALYYRRASLDARDVKL